MKYKIYVIIPFGYDDTLCVEYNGVIYDSYEEARNVYNKIKAYNKIKMDDPRCTYGRILDKWIEEVD